MQDYCVTDTIAAISTPVGEGGIGIVRLSGTSALEIADRIFASCDGKRPSEFKTYTTHYGFIVSPLARYPVNPPNRRTGKQANRQTDIIDEVILTVMRSPRSYTKEDIVEINCHGGIIALRDVLDLVLGNGARLAEPGEFTKRAFLNGRIDLAQAEAVLDIIRAKTDSALRVSQEQLRGQLSNSINKIRETLLGILVVLEANIDFPEEETGATDLGKMRIQLKEVNGKLKDMLEDSKRGRIFREGIHVVICGRPNVGKSSLLNALLKQERSIVTAIPGTTRDTIEEIIDIKGIPVRIVDTAGILEPRDLVEKKAVERSKKHIAQADIAIILFDGSRKLSKEDEVIIKKLKEKQSIAIINKMDLKQKVERARIARRFNHVIDICAKKARNIGLLEEKIAELVYKGKVFGPEPVMVSNLRHISSIREAEILIAQAAGSLDNKLSPEFIAQDIKDALICLDGLLGKKFSEDLLDKIFSEFCIGK
jgi:tRNA modification GTPase